MRIGIVNDLKMTAEVLRRMVITIPDYEVIWIAYDGQEAVEKTLKNKPDLILMDLIMPIMDGVEATKQIMIKSPCPILIVTASVTSNSAKVFEAMGYGALDVIRTPALDSSKPDLGGKELLAKIEKIQQLTGKNGTKRLEKSKVIGEESSSKIVTIPPLLIIGSSTGGPGALSKILGSLPERMPIATVIIQHVDEQFAPGLAHWLSDQTGQHVQIAYDGAQLLRGVVLMGGRNDHLIMGKDLKLSYTVNPIENPYRPSVDVFFSSVSDFWPQKSLAVILTGMGNDGAIGMKRLKDNGWHTIAQDAKSCVVFGMPKAAIAKGAASEILPLDNIPLAIKNFFTDQANNDRK